MTCFCLVTVDYSFSSLFNVYPASLSLLVLSRLPSYATPLIIYSRDMYTYSIVLYVVQYVHNSVRKHDTWPWWQRITSAVVDYRLKPFSQYVRFGCNFGSGQFLMSYNIAHVPLCQMELNAFVVINKTVSHHYFPLLFFFQQSGGGLIISYCHPWLHWTGFCT